MMVDLKSQKRKHGSQHQKNHGRGKNQHADRTSNFISMSEARQIAEHLFSGIAWSG